MPEPVDIQRFRDGLGGVAVRQGSVERGLRLLIRVVCRLVTWQVDASGFDGLPSRGAVLRGPGASW